MPTPNETVVTYLQAASKALKQGDRPLYDAFMARANEEQAKLAPAERVHVPAAPCHGRRLV